MSQDIPATEKQMLPGVRVKCIFKKYCGSIGNEEYYGETGTVSGLTKGGNFIIKWDNPSVKDPLGWGSASSFTILQNDIPATKEQMVVGARVRCIVHLNDRYGQSGTIIEIKDASLGLLQNYIYMIRWDGEDEVELAGWIDPNSFTMLSLPPDFTETVESEQQIPSPIPTIHNIPSFDFNTYNGFMPKIKG